MGTVSQIVQVGPRCDHQCPYKSQAEGDLTMKQEENNNRSEKFEGYKEVTSQGMLAASRRWKRQRCSSPQSLGASKALLTP